MVGQLQIHVSSKFQYVIQRHTSKRVELNFKFRLLALVEKVLVACVSFYFSSPSPSAPSVLYPS